MRLLPLLLLLTLPATPPALAEAAGPVERLVLAQGLYEAGLAGRDGLSQLAAARLAAGVAVQRVERKPESTGPESTGPESTGGGKPGATPAPRDAAAMRTGARAAVAADETLDILMTTTEAAAAVLPKGVVKGSEATLAQGQSHGYRLPAEGDVALDLGVLSDGSARLELEVTTDTGVLCKATAFCRVRLPESGFVTITLRNAGETEARYLFISN